MNSESNKEAEAPKFPPGFEPEAVEESLQNLEQNVESVKAEKVDESSEGDVVDCQKQQADDHDSESHVTISEVVIKSGEAESETTVAAEGGNKEQSKEELKEENEEFEEYESTESSLEDDGDIIGFLEECGVPRSQINNLGEVYSEAKDSETVPRCVESTESDDADDQMFENFDFDPHAVTVALDVKCVEDESSAKILTLKGEAYKIQQKEESKENKSDEMKENLKDVPEIVVTEVKSVAVGESEAPQEEEGQSIPDNAKSEMSQKAETEIVVPEAGDKAEAVGYKNVDAKMQEECTQSELVPQEKDESSPILDDTDNEVPAAENNKNENVSAVDKADKIERVEAAKHGQHEIQPSNSFSCDDTVTRLTEDDTVAEKQEQSIQHHITQQEKDKVSESHAPYAGNVETAVDEADKTGSVEAAKHGQYQIQPSNLFPCGDTVINPTEYDAVAKKQEQTIQQEKDRFSEFFVSDVRKAEAAAVENNKNENLDVYDETNKSESVEAAKHGQYDIQSSNSFSCGDTVTRLTEDDTVAKKQEQPTQQEIIQQEKDKVSESHAPDAGNVEAAVDEVDKTGSVEAAKHGQYDIQSSNSFSCGDAVTDRTEDASVAKKQEQSPQHQITQQEKDTASETHVPDASKSETTTDENDKDGEFTVIEKVHTNECDETTASEGQQRPHQSCNLFSSGNIGAEIQKSRNQCEVVQEQLESKILDFPPGFEPEESVELRQVGQSEATQHQQYVKEPGDTVADNTVVVDSQDIASTEVSSEIQQQQPLTEASDSTSDSVINAPAESFNNTFDEFFKKFLENDSSNLDGNDIKSFSESVPTDFVVSDDRFPTLFKTLFKIKEISNKTIADESLSLLRKLFVKLDFNKFLLEFWSCDEFKNRENGPIGFSFTGGSAVYDFGRLLPKYEHDAEKVKEKAVEAAWSILLDVEATVTQLMETAVTNKVMCGFYIAVLRRFKCLGEFMINVLGNEVPLFIYVYRRLFVDADTNKLILGLTCLVNVCKSSINDGYALMKPNYGLCEVMSLLVLDNDKQPSYMLALRRFFTQPSGFECWVDWDFESGNYDNPTCFFRSFIKYFNRKQAVIENNEVLSIFESFKESLIHSDVQLTNLQELDENAETDWPFVYKIVQLLEIQNFRHRVPDSLFMILPENVMENFVTSTDPEPTIQKALTGIIELHFVSGGGSELPEALFKNLWSIYSPTSSIIDIFGRAIVEAYNNLKSAINVAIDNKFADFLSTVYGCYFTSDVVRSDTAGYEMDFEYINSSSHLIILGRALRLIVEEKVERDGKKLAFNSISSFFILLFNLFVTKIHEQFYQLRGETEGTWPPWRKGNAPCMDDQLSMAINHLLNEIQKEIFLVYDQTFGHSPGLMDLLFFLCRQRKYYGLRHPKLEAALLERHPDFFQPRDGPPQQQQQRFYQGQSNYRNQGYRRPQDDYGQQQNQSYGGYRQGDSSQDRPYQSRRAGYGQDRDEDRSSTETYQSRRGGYQQQQQQRDEAQQAPATNRVSGYSGYSGFSGNNTAASQNGPRSSQNGRQSSESFRQDERPDSQNEWAD